MDLTEEFLLEDIQTVFHDRLLMQGALKVDGRRVEPRAMSKTSVMAIEAAYDDLAPPGQTCAALDLVGGGIAERRHVLIEGCGHFSLLHGRICRAKVVPEILSLAESASQRRRPPHR